MKRFGTVRHIPNFTIVSVVILLTLLVNAGCEMFQPTYSHTNQTDRLLKAYPDINTGRFALIADFESTDHIQLVHMDSEAGSVAVTTRASGPPTGFNCLKATFDSTTRLLIDNTNAGEWFLKTDWRDFDLFLMQVRSSTGNVQLDICVTGGLEGNKSTICTNRALTEGWNPIRLDIAEIAEQIPIDEISQIAISVPNQEETISLEFDDLILAGNTRDLFGHSDGVNGGLFLRRKGLRWFVGAAGRFEVGFSGGQIVQWHDLQNDPNRLYNLVKGAVMGPSPFVVPPRGNLFSEPVEGNNDDFPALGKTIVARQKIREMSAGRIVVEGEWRNARPGQSFEEAPSRRWTWSIYPTGEIYVQVKCTTQQEGWQPEEIGLAIARADRDDVEEYIHTPARLEDPEPIRHLAFGWMRARDLAAPALLMIMHDSTKTPELYFLRDEQTAQAAMIAAGGEPARPTESWACLLDIWPADNWFGSNPVNRALDYARQDERIRVDTGELVRDDPGDQNQDGFRESDGCYLLRPTPRKVSFTVDGSAVPLHNPVFVIQKSQWDKAWVYVDYALQADPQRDEYGNLLFQLPGRIDTTKVVEVYFRSQPADTTPGNE